MLHVHSVQWNAGMGNTDTILVSVLFPSLHMKYFRIKFLLLVVTRIQLSSAIMEAMFSDDIQCWSRCASTHVIVANFEKAISGTGSHTSNSHTHFNVTGSRTQEVRRAKHEK